MNGARLCEAQHLASDKAPNIINALFVAMCCASQRRAPAEADIIKISFTKKGVDSIAIYSRLRGTAAWTKIGVDTTSPFDDTRALAVAGVPEAREYMAQGVLNDVEIGVASDIASITFAG